MATRLDDLISFELVAERNNRKWMGANVCGVGERRRYFATRKVLQLGNHERRNGGREKIDGERVDTSSFTSDIGIFVREKIVTERLESRNY